MRDKRLTALIILATIFSLGHTTDHILRGDLRWPLTADSVAFIVINLTVYTLIALGLYFYWKNKVGPGFWAVFTSVGALFGWFAHFSPFTDQPPRYIFASYASASAGWLALLSLSALMLVLIVASVYASYLWARRLPLR